MWKMSCEMRCRLFLLFLLLSLVTVRLPVAAFWQDGAKKPNILFLVIDALRQDALGNNGTGGTNTPFMDQLAKQSRSFSRCYAGSSTTKPSVVTLWTSSYPSEHGIVYRRDRMRDETITLAEVLAAAGYHTALFTGNPWLTEEFNMVQGFHCADFISYQESPNGKVNGKEVNRVFEEWIQPATREPFFAHIHYMDCHASTINYRQFYPETELESYCLNGPVPKEFDASVTENMKREYGKSVLFTDHLVKEIVEMLKKKGMWERTILVLTADHGEEFGDHGGLGHGTSLHEELLRVPLVIHHPGLSPGESDIPVSHVDMLPTVCDWAGLLPPAGISGKRLEELERNENLQARPFFARVVSLDDNSDRFTVIWQEHKYIYNRSTNKEILYNLREDPQEKHPLKSSPKQLLGRLRSEVEKQVNIAKRIPRPRHTPDISQETLSVLKDIGYLH